MGGHSWKDIVFTFYIFLNKWVILKFSEGKKRKKIDQGVLPPPLFIGERPIYFIFFFLIKASLTYTLEFIY